MNQKLPGQELREIVCRSLADMLPSTAEEIADSAGLEAAAVASCLDELTQRYLVMFNPLTKRYSLPKVRAGNGLAA